MPSIPTVRLWKGAESVRVNEADAGEWIAQGWSAEQPEGVGSPTLFSEPAPRKRKGTSKTGDEVASEPAADAESGT